MLYNAVLVSIVQQSESATHIHISPLFWISFPFTSPQSIEKNSRYFKSIFSKYLIAGFVFSSPVLHCATKRQISRMYMISKVLKKKEKQREKGEGKEKKRELVAQSLKRLPAMRETWV